MCNFSRSQAIGTKRPHPRYARLGEFTGDPTAQVLEEDGVDRRNFLTGMLGIAGVSLIASAAGQGNALAGVPGRGGVLHLLDEPEPDGIEPEVDAAEEE